MGRGFVESNKQKFDTVFFLCVTLILVLLTFLENGTLTWLQTRAKIMMKRIGKKRSEAEGSLKESSIDYGWHGYGQTRPIAFRLGRIVRQD